MATTETIELKVKLDDQASRQLRSIDKALNSLNGRMGGLSTSSGAAAGALGGLTSKLSATKIGLAAVGVGAVAVTKAIIDSARAFENVTQQLNLVTNGTDDYNRTLARLTALSKETLSDFGATVDLFTNLSTVTEELGLSTRDVEELTRKFSKALVVAGADAQTAAAVTRQFGQAMASGTVRGDEFVSISEGLGRALSIIAKESGHTIGSLRKLSQSGGLTADVFAKMLLGSDGLDEAFEKLEPTTDQLQQQLANSAQQLSALLFEASGAKTILDGLTIALTKVADAVVNAGNSAMNIDPITKSINELQNRIDELQRTDFSDPITLKKGTGEAKSQAEMAEELAQAYAEAYGVATKSVKENSEETEENTKKVTANSIRIKHLKSVIADLNAFKREQNRLLNESNKGNDDAAAKEEAHRKELLATVFVYGDALTNALAYKTELQTLEEELRKQQTALHNYNRAFALGINRQGAGSEATRKFMEDTTALGDAIVRTTEKIDKLKRQMEISENPYLGLIDRHKELTAESRKLSEQLIIASANMALADGDTEAFEFAIAALKEQLKRVNAELDQYNEKVEPTLEEQVNKTIKLNEENEKLFKQYNDGTRTIEELAEAARILGVELEEPTKGLETYKEFSNRMEEAAKETVNLTKNQTKLFEQLKKIKKETGELTDVQKVQFDQLSELFNKADENAFNLAKSVEEAFEKSLTSVSGAIADMVLGLGNGFTSLKDIAMNTLRSIIAALIEATIRKAIFNSLNITAGSGTTVGSALLGALGGASALPGIGLLVGAGALLGGLFANGGTVNSGRKPILVGERGPELFLPGRAGEVIANENLTNMSGGDPVTVQFNINAIDTQTGAQFILENKRLITGVVQDAYRRRAETGPLG